MKLIEDLSNCEDFKCIFELVKQTVEETINRRRTGLMLALQDISPNIGAYYPVGSNFIIMNKQLLGWIEATQDKQTTNAYIFYVLLHEYLHALGYLDEAIVRQLSYEICRQTLGENHISTLIAKYGLGSFLSGLNYIESEPENMKLEIITDFENVSYIG